MLKSFFTSTLILLFFAVFEAAVLTNIVWLPAVPDFLLICVLYFSIRGGRLNGEINGFISGLFLDFLTAGPFGIHCLLRTIIGFVGGLFKKTLNTNGFFIPCVLGICATLFKLLMLYIISFFFPNSVRTVNPVSWAFFMELVLNGLFTPLMFKFLAQFDHLIIVDEESAD